MKWINHEKGDFTVGKCYMLYFEALHRVDDKRFVSFVKLVSQGTDDARHILTVTPYLTVGGSSQRTFDGSGVEEVSALHHAIKNIYELDDDEVTTFLLPRVI